MNTVLLTARVASAPVLNTAKSGTTYTRLRLALEERAKATTFVTATAFGKLAETCAEYLEVGQKVEVAAKLTTRKVKHAGALREVDEIQLVARDVTFLEKSRSRAPEAAQERAA